MNELYSSKPLCREDLLMSKLKNFFNSKEYLKILIDIVSGNSEISLRDIDWFVTNYSKKYNIIYNIEEILNSEIIKKQFIVFINYKSQLKAFGKSFFDPFCSLKEINRVVIVIRNTCRYWENIRIKNDILRRKAYTN